jgi:hypothetical protein
VLGLTNELNGLSLGGIGRAPDIHHVEIMNNVDDGVEIWGGTVSTKYMSVWNVGDDSFDVDQGHRGEHRFILIVQGYSLDVVQGSSSLEACDTFCNFNDIAASYFAPSRAKTCRNTSNGWNASRRPDSRRSR